MGSIQSVHRLDLACDPNLVPGAGAVRPHPATGKGAGCSQDLYWEGGLAQLRSLSKGLGSLVVGKGGSISCYGSPTPPPSFPDLQGTLQDRCHSFVGKRFKPPYLKCLDSEIKASFCSHLLLAHKIRAWCLNHILLVPKCM